MTEENFEETQTEETTSEETSTEAEQTETLLPGQEEGESLEEFATRISTEKADLEEKNKQLFARAKKVPKKVESSNSNLTREEAILYAKGYTDEEIAKANKIAKVDEVSVLVAIEDDIVKNMIQTRLAKERSDKASLGASGGSGVKTTKNVGEMTTEEHAKLFHETMSKV